MTRRERDDRGIVHAVELTYATLVMVLIVAVVAFLGRSAAADSRVASMARVAARAGSLENGPDAAAATARARLIEDGKELGCDFGRAGTIVITTSGGPGGGWLGGSITVQVRCIVHNGRLATVWVPGDRTFAASDTEAIEANRL